MTENQSTPKTRANSLFPCQYRHRATEAIDIRGLCDHLRGIQQSENHDSPVQHVLYRARRVNWVPLPVPPRQDLV